MTPRLSPEARFFAKVAAPTGDVAECWEWSAHRRDGYGRFQAATRTAVGAHRWSWEHFNGPIPAGLVLDHIYRNRACVNPWHLEPVSLRENIRRGVVGEHLRRRTHCPSGHPYDDENTYRSRQGRRHCRTCLRARDVAARKESK